MKVILASASPRRQALLQQIGITTLVCPADFAEGSGTASQAQEVALHNAAGKCAAVAAKMGDELPVIAADTIVVIDNVILGKPQDAAAAKAMLQRLSGRTHQVMTGIAVRYKGQQLSEVCITDVSFRQLTAEEIDAYIATGEPMDKAGAYGVQEWIGYIGVKSISGSFYNIMGLPIQKLYGELKKL